MKRLHPERLHKTVLIVCVLCLVGALTTTYFDAKASTEALVAAGWEDYLDISDASSLTFNFSCLFNNACRPIAWEQFTAQRFFQLTRGLIIGFFVFMLLAAIINLFFSAGPEEKDPGGGNFAVDEDLKAYLSDGKDPGNPRKGHYGYTESGKQLRAPLRDRCTHLAIFAGTGGGKTTRIIKPSLIQDALDGTSVLMVDPKWPDPRGGYSDILAVFKKQGYEVQVFCPFEEHTLKLPLIGSLQSHDDAEVLASIIVPKTTSGEVSDGSQFYRNQERELLKHLLWGEAQAGRGSIGDVYDLIDGGPKALLRWLEHCEDQKIHKSITTLMQNRQETLIGIIQGLKGSLSIFTNERLDAATQAGSHGWQNLDASSLTKKKSVLYVGIPQQMFLRGEGKLLLNLFFRRIMDEVLGIATQQGGRLERHLAVYIDEFAHIGKLDHAGSWFGTMRSYNIAFTVALQNRAQLEMVYGSVGARAMEGGNFQHLITFPAALKGDDKEYVSKLLGEVTAEDISRSRSHEGIFGQYRWTETRRRVARPLLSREEMNKWDPDYGVLMPHGAGPTKIAAPMIHQRRVGKAKNGFYKFRDMIGKGDSLTLVKTLLSQYKVAWRIPDPPEEKQPKPVPSGEAITPRVDVFEAQRVAEAAPTSAAEEDLTVPLTPQDVQVSPIQIAKESTPTKGEKAPAKKSAGRAPRKKSQPSPGQGEALHHVPSGQLMPSFRTWVEGLSWRDVPLTVFRVREGGQDRISKILFEQLPGALRHEHLAHWKQRRWIQVRGDKLGIINNGCVVLCQKQLDSFLALPQAQIVEVGDGNERVVVKARAVASKQLNTAKKRDNDTSTSGKHLAASTLSSSKDDLKVQALLRTWLRGNGYRLDGHPDYDCWRDQLPHKALLGRYIPEVLYVQESYLKNLTGLPSQAITRFPRSTQRIGDEEVFTRAIPGEVVRHALPLRKLLADDAILLEDHPSRTGAEKAVGIYQAATIQSQKATLQAVTGGSLEHLSEQILKVGQRKGEKRRSMRLLTLPLQPEPLPAPNA